MNIVFNSYHTEGDVTVIDIHRKNGELVQTSVDTEDMPIILQDIRYLWATFNKCTNSYYVWAELKDGNRMYLHRWLMGNPKGYYIDHFDNITTNNHRKSNLRKVSPSGNQQNRKGAQHDSSSGVRGVYFDKQTGRWRAQVRFNGKPKALGRFDTIEEAEAVVKAARAQMMPYSKEGVMTMTEDAPTPYESDIVTEAFNELMIELFGEVPKNVGEKTIDRDIYTEAMQRVQSKYDLSPGHPDYLEFIFTLIGRSPRFTKGAEAHVGNSEEAGDKETVGEAPPCPTDTAKPDA